MHIYGLLGENPPMCKANSHFQKLKTAYIFPIIEKKLAKLQEEHPNQKVINLGVGDISLPLAPAIAQAFQQAIEEMCEKPRGYGPCEGYPFLRDTISAQEYAHYGIGSEEIFISEGANADISSLLTLFDDSCTVLVSEPSYPVYRDASLIAGKTLLTLHLKEEGGFIPRPPPYRADLVYLCTPSNPIGVALNEAHLSEWIEWAKKHRSFLILDNVYQRFVTTPSIPPSIYSLEGGKEVAIEMRSFSKWAGFTGLRCGYTVVPKTLHDPKLNSFWAKLIDIQRNGISYPIQRAAEACYTPQVQKQLSEQLDIYSNSALRIREVLEELGQTFFGGVDSPYIWWKVPAGRTSWEFFDELLTKARLLTIPGSGFGPTGEGYVRLSCFQTEETAREAANALRHHFDATELLS